MKTGIDIPFQVLQRWAGFHGPERTRAWVDALPQLLTEVCAAWEIELERERPALSFSLVLFGRSGQLGDVVLKLAPPSPEVESEIEALRQTSGHGSVQLHAADASRSFMVLARVRPGTTLEDEVRPDDEATRIGARMMREFWREPTHTAGLFPLEQWIRPLLDHETRNRPGAPGDLIRHAGRIARRLLDEPRDELLLHGDMHHHNILRDADRGWVVIDPKGLVGERGYEIGTWMMNPWGFPGRDDFLSLAHRRLDIFAEEFGTDRRRLAGWAVVHATLVLCWALEEEHPENLELDHAYARSMFRLLD